jgi:hypothetical protein
VIGTADLWTALVTAWNGSSIDSLFRTLWDSTVEANYQSLSDKIAEPKQPFPYCVVEVMKPHIVTRMTGDEDTKRHIREVMITFRVWAVKIANDARSAKMMAADLAEEIMKLFGGHPVVKPKVTLTLSNGGVINMQYQSDWSEPAELYRCSHEITYKAVIDVSVAV